MDMFCLPYVMLVYCFCCCYCFNLNQFPVPKSSRFLRCRTADQVLLSPFTIWERSPERLCYLSEITLSWDQITGLLTSSPGSFPSSYNAVLEHYTIRFFSFHLQSTLGIPSFCVASIQGPPRVVTPIQSFSSSKALHFIHLLFSLSSQHLLS